MPVDPWLVLVSLAVEAAFGYPQMLYARIAHPVVWFGRLIDALERRWNNSLYKNRTQRLAGIACVAIVVTAAVLPAMIIQMSAMRVSHGEIIIVLVATAGLAQRSLYVHVRDVETWLQKDDVVAARTAVAKIVGRDTNNLDSAGIGSAALESLAESFNDGVVAPAFWLLVAGLPGLFAYKALNTADSLIGHREPRWREFGWAAARGDDVANWVPARIAGLLLVLGAGRGVSTMWRDAAKHDSPNAGWPEAAMAGALGIKLGGAAWYEGIRHGRPVFGEGRVADSEDLRRGLRLYLRAGALLWLIIAACGVCFVAWRFGGP